ncbi:phospholipase D LarSicTox-alphaIB2c-like isoform X5 [Dendronephthya gigantea]|uniref:phospholipase D LarSicTox-alphaIB2c-like isoform X5 n=1 Tax=Dendronephthya gigantea TaxID=151771 RepID=UPI00106A6D57|nr:phospholipase D LarSicTox-alphaIB2c-like isoform X5 [Dendronephthya gigantea]
MSQYSFFVLVVSLTLDLVVCDRPTYNIAHMVNAATQIKPWLGYGANALEADVAFSEYGTPEYTYHGIPCDAGRDCLRWAYIGNFITALRARTRPYGPRFNRNLVLVMFDCKLNDLAQNMLPIAGWKFANIILKRLYRNNRTKMKVIVSVQNLSQKEFIRSVITSLQNNPEILANVGWEISWDNEKEPQELEQGLKEVGVQPGHAWLSSGITNFAAGLKLDELKKEVEYRDSGNFFSKVYAWTLDKQSTAMKYLEIHLDGVIANYPSRVNKAIEQYNKERGYIYGVDKVRLATLNDNPFQRF